jgi:hypothetical protein
MSSTRELAQRIDATSAEIAELAERVSALEGRVAAARRLAQEAEAELARSPATEESSPDVARQTFIRRFGLLALGSLGFIAFVALAMLSIVPAIFPGSCSSEYRFAAEGSVLATPDRALLAASCDVEVEETGRDRCHAKVTCDDRELFDATVDCRIEVIGSRVGDGAPTTTRWLVASAAGFELREATRTVQLGDGADATRVGHMRWESEGEL